MGVALGRARELGKYRRQCLQKLIQNTKLVSNTQNSVTAMYVHTSCIAESLGMGNREAFFRSSGVGDGFPD